MSNSIDKGVFEILILVLASLMSISGAPFSDNVYADLVRVCGGAIAALVVISCSALTKSNNSVPHMRILSIIALATLIASIANEIERMPVIWGAAFIIFATEGFAANKKSNKNDTTPYSLF